MAIHYQTYQIQTPYRTTTILSPQTLNFESYRGKIETYFNDFVVHYGILDLENSIKLLEDFIEENQPRKRQFKVVLNQHALVKTIIEKLQFYRFNEVIPREIIAVEIQYENELEELGNDLEDMILILVDTIIEQLALLSEVIQTPCKFHIVQWLNSYTPLISTGIEFDYSVNDPFNKIFTWFEEI